MLMLPQLCPVCDQLLVALHDESDPSDVLYLCTNMLCESRDAEGQDIWNIEDLESMRAAKATYGYLTKNGKRIGATSKHG